MAFRRMQKLVPRAMGISAVVGASNYDRVDAKECWDHTPAGSTHYDMIVIGGGSGGSGVSKRAAGYGKKVCVIERGAKYDEQG